MLGGMKCLGFGGIRLKDYPGQWWGSRQHMDVSLGRFKLYIIDTMQPSILEGVYKRLKLIKIFVKRRNLNRNRLESLEKTCY